MLIEIIKLIASVTTPVVVTIIGVLLLRREEGIKAEVTRSSDFYTKWADDFYETSQEFMRTTERYLSLLFHLQARNDPNDSIGLRYQEECNELNVCLSELEMRIKRSVVFSPTSGAEVKQAAQIILATLSNMFKTKHGNFDDSLQQIDAFNTAAQIAHAEMLRVSRARSKS